MSDNNSSVKDKFRNVIATRVSLTDVVLATLRHWPWLIASVVICVGAAWLYLLYTPSVYTRTASILIKGDNSSKGSGSSEMDVLSNMGIVSTSSNINDELNKIQSPDVMKEVVSRLNLDMLYQARGNYHKKLLYGNTQPITVSLPAMLTNESANMTVTVSPEGEVTFSDVKFNDEKVEAPDTKSHLGDTIVTTLGPVVVNATPYLPKGHEIKVYVTKLPFGSALAQFRSEFSAVRKGNKDNVIILTVNDRSIQRADDILNAVIDVYSENWMADRNRISTATSNFINERLKVIESELGHVDNEISSYQSKNLIPDVQEAASIYMNENREADAQISEQANRQQIARHLRSYVADPNNKYSAMPANVGVDNQAVEELISQYNELALKREKYIDGGTNTTHPVVTDLESRMQGLRSAIITSIDGHINAINTNISNLRKVQNKATSQLAANPTQAKYLLSVERQQKVKESLYLFLLQKREENELSQAFTAYNTEVITRPGGSSAPTSPQKAKILLGALVLGLIIPFGVNYLLESNNNKVRGRKDVEVLSLPFLGEIPDCKPKKGENTTGRIVVKQGKRNVINEAFRVLRTNLGFMTANDKGCNVIMVTSFNPGSGKSFLTMNLAVSLAIKGKRVLVVDGDLRRCTTSSYVDTPSQGLSNYLVHSVTDIKSVIVADSIVPNLSVLPVGTIPPNPTELLETETFTNLIKQLRSDYDYILLDCPPVEMMADAQIINTVADRTIFVVRAGLFVRAMLPELERLYDEHKFKNMCVVLNATPAGEARAYGKYGYAYGYGYGDYSHYTSEK